MTDNIYENEIPQVPTPRALGAAQLLDSVYYREFYTTSCAEFLDRAINGADADIREESRKLYLAVVAIQTHIEQSATETMPAPQE